MNVESLRQRNAELRSELISLQKEPQRTVVLARSLDLYNPGDRVIQIEGLDSSRPVVPVGDMLSYNSRR